MKSEVVRRRQVEHTKAERRIMGGIDHPFVVALRFAFRVYGGIKVCVSRILNSDCDFYNI